MKNKRTFTHGILASILLMISVYANSQTATENFIISKSIRVPLDSPAKTIFFHSLDGFLSEKYATNADNPYVLNNRILETFAFLDELKGIRTSKVINDDHFYKCYVTNILKQNDSVVQLQFSYIGVKDSLPILKANFKLLAQKIGAKYYFYSALKENTLSWKKLQLGNVAFYYLFDINQAKAGDYERMVANYDSIINLKSQSIEFYSCNNFSEVLNLLGIEYKIDYNGQNFNSISSDYQGSSLFVAGTKKVNNFNHIDPHDFWHETLHKVVSTDVINRPVDEGCAYLYGGSWGMSWQDILTKFKSYAIANPNADWMELYNSSFNFNDANLPPLNVDHMINALIVKKLEKEAGFAKVEEILTCGKYEPGNNNYFNALQKSAGISRKDFNKKVWLLIKNSMSFS